MKSKNNSRKSVKFWIVAMAMFMQGASFFSHDVSAAGGAGGGQAKAPSSKAAQDCDAAIKVQQPPVEGTAAYPGHVNPPFQDPAGGGRSAAFDDYAAGADNVVSHGEASTGGARAGDGGGYGDDNRGHGGGGFF